MSQELALSARRDITKKLAAEYTKAGKVEKGEILDALVKATGWHRDHARRALRLASQRKGAAWQQQRKPAAKGYSYDARVVLQEVWHLSGEPCGKYLAVVMDDMLGRLMRFNELGRVGGRVTDDVLSELRSMSGATIDRYLAPHKKAMYPAASLSGTRPSLILRSSIQVRTSMDPFPDTGGLLELDTVAHCGWSLKGDFCYTLSATDPVYGWTMLRAVKNKAFANVHPALDWVREHAPYTVTAMDFDNGSEFINWAVVAWADSHGITLTRGRPYQHNDNAHVEQRNGDWVRKHAFRYRYETPEELNLLNQLWDLVMARKNHLLPCVKATGWATTESGRKKRVYDTPATPYQRIINAGILNANTAAKLAAEHAKLDPAKITRQINTIQQRLIALAAYRTQTGRQAA